MACTYHDQRMAWLFSRSVHLRWHYVYAPFLAMKAALDFRISIGGESAIFSYIHDLAVRAGQMLASAWATDVLLDQNMYAAMVDVRVPTRNLTVAAAM